MKRFIPVAYRLRIKIFLYVVVPVFLISAVAFSLYSHYETRFQQERELMIRNRFDETSDLMDRLFEEISAGTVLLGQSPHLRDIFSSEIDISLKNYYKLQILQELLGSYRMTKDFLGRAYISLASEDMNIHPEGTCHRSSLNDETSYLDESSWERLFSAASYPLLLLPLESDEGKSDPSMGTLAIVNNRIGSIYSSNLFIIELDRMLLADLLKTNQYTQSSLIHMVNQDGDTLFSTGSENLPPLSLLDGTLVWREHEYRVIVRKADNSLFDGLYYILTVDENDFHDHRQKRILYLILISISAAILINFLVSHRLYSPIKALVNLLNRENTPPGNEYEYLETRIGSLMENKESLERELSSALPMIRNNSLRHLLNNGKFEQDEKTMVILKQEGLDFSQPLFTAAVINLVFTEAIDEMLSLDRTRALAEEIGLILQKSFAPRYQSTVIAMDENNLAHLVNHADDNQSDDLHNIWNGFFNLLAGDEHHITVNLGIGRSQTGWQGAHRSYLEGFSALSRCEVVDASHLVIYDGKDTTAGFTYSMEDEAKLYNLLISARKKELELFLADLQKSMMPATLSSPAKRELLLQLYYTGLRVLYNRPATPLELMGDDFINVMSGPRTLSVSLLEEYVVSFLHRITDLADRRRSRLKKDEVIEYISSHYREQIFLEDMAHTFSVTPKYFSRYFRNTFGQSYYTYLTGLRIDYSKKLLTEKKASVVAAGEQSGFPSRSTFVRMFKKCAGMTPSEYRKSHRIT